MMSLRVLTVVLTIVAVINADKKSPAKAKAPVPASSSKGANYATLASMLCSMNRNMDFCGSNKEESSAGLRSAFKDEKVLEALNNMAEKMTRELRVSKLKLNKLQRANAVRGPGNNVGLQNNKRPGLQSNQVSKRVQTQVRRVIAGCMRDSSGASCKKLGMDKISEKTSPAEKKAIMQNAMKMALGAAQKGARGRPGTSSGLGNQNIRGPGGVRSTQKRVKGQKKGGPTRQSKRDQRISRSKARAQKMKAARQSKKSVKAVKAAKAAKETKN